MGARTATVTCGCRRVELKASAVPKSTFLAWSQNLLKAAKFVQDNGGKVIGLAGFDGGALKQVADACIVAPVDSTPQVEGFHAVLTHLLCAGLRELITEGV